MRQYGELESKFRDIRRQNLALTMDEQKVPAELRTAKLVEIESMPVTWLHIDEWLMSCDGASEAIRMSLRGATDAEQHIDSLNIIQAVQIARLVVGTAELKVTDPPRAASVTGSTTTPPYEPSITLNPPA